MPARRERFRVAARPRISCRGRRDGNRHHVGLSPGPASFMRWFGGLRQKQSESDGYFLEAQMAYTVNVRFIECVLATVAAQLF